MIARSAVLLAVIAAWLGALRWFPSAGDGLSPTLPRSVAHVVLRSSSRGAVTLVDGVHPVAVAFGYVGCGDVCPRTLATLSAIVTRGGLRERPVIAFVDVDSRHDTPAAVAAYVRRFPGVEGFTAGASVVEGFERSLGAREVVSDSDVPAHDARVFVLDAHGLLLASLPPGSTAADLASLLR